MIEIKEVLKILKDPSLTFGSLPADNISDLQWFVTLQTKAFYNNGYFVCRDSVNKLKFPDIDYFASNSEAQTDLFNLYSAFAWRGFLHYCQPGVDSLTNSLNEFLFRGKQHLDPETAGYMLRFPSAAWLDSLLELNSITPTDEIRALIEKNKLVSGRNISADFKHVQSRLYALLYLLDHMAFMHRYYDADLNSQKELVTRSPEILRILLGADAEDYINALYNVDLFDSPVTGSVLVVSINLNRDSGAGCTPTGELTYIDTNDRFSRFLPLFQCFAYADGIADRINDMPNKAAILTLDFKKTGLTTRYATMDKDVMKSLYEDTCVMKVNTRAHVDLGFDVFDEFGFKYWNLQSSISAVRNYSAFNLFSLYGISACDMSQLSQGILSADYKLISDQFKKAVEEADEAKLEKMARICSINPQHPRLRRNVLDWGERHHPSEVYKVISEHKDLFK